MDYFFYNGDILTMEDSTPEAVLVKNGLIHKVGTLQEVVQEASPNAQQVDLKGCTLLPAFVDAHSHITALAQTMELTQLGTASCTEELIRLLTQAKEQRELQPGEWLIGFGYDHNSLKNGAHPTKRELDAAFPDNPVMITHASGHMGVVNSLALAQLGITKDTKDPEGGKIGRMENSSEPSGYLEETAFTSLSGNMPAPSLEEQCRMLKQAEAIYFENGICTAQDGLTGEKGMTLLTYMAETGRLKIDVVSYIDMRNDPGLAKTNTAYVKRYHNHFKIGGYKILLDGSPQGKTAWLSRPYENSGDYCGYPVFAVEQVASCARRALSEHMQLLAHCNGDAASGQFLNAFEEALTAVPAPDTRPVMIHAQTVRADQLPRLRRLRMIPSFFVEHTYYWGDVHIKNLGMKRAKCISPARSAGALGIPYTFHQDTPVLPPNMIETVWCAVNRITRDGVVLDGEQVTPYEALKAVTLNAAYQYFEEESKGSIREGKRADFVILDQNPCKVEPRSIRGIQVLATILGGETVYRRHS